MTQSFPRHGNDVDSALDILDAAELRTLVRDALANLPPSARAIVEDLIVGRAVEGRTGWRPPAPERSRVEAILRAAKRAAVQGHAQPEEIDDALREGDKAFLARDLASAARIFEALLPPLADGSICVEGVDEMVSEVLTVDIDQCVRRFLASVYETTPAERRADAVWETLQSVSGLVYFALPIDAMEKTLAAPLSGVDSFLPAWLTLLEGAASGKASEWETEPQRWLREAVGRTEGTAGLERLARSSRRPEAVRAWCVAVALRGDSAATLAALEQGASFVSSTEEHAHLLDAAARAAMELGHKDVPARLEAAWQASPTMARLLRWLVAGNSKPGTLRTRAREGIEHLPKDAWSLRGILHLIAGQPAEAAALLANAPGTGWSSWNDPGQVLFPALAFVLVGAPRNTLRGALATAILCPPGEFGRNSADGALSHTGALPAHPIGETFSDDDSDDDGEAEENLIDSDRSGDREHKDIHAASVTTTSATPTALEALPAPSLLDVITRSRVREELAPTVRPVLRDALRAAAIAHTDGVTAQQRRGHYEHAARLVACCVEVDGAMGNAGEGAAWAAQIKTRTRRYPAFQARLQKALAQIGRTAG